MNRFTTFLTRLTAGAAALWLGSLTPALAVEYTAIQPEKSTLSFVYKQMNVPVEGKFKKFAVQLRFDPAKPQAGSAVIDLDLASIDAGSDEANDEVAGKLWFNTKLFPTARFVSSAITTQDAARKLFSLRGQMTIKGRTQEVVAPFSLTAPSAQDKNAVAEGTFTLKRSDFAIGEGIWADYGTVANEIQIKFRFPVLAGK